MANELTAFTLDNIAVRERDGLFSLNDLHRASGGDDRNKPSRWAKSERTQALVQEISKDQKRALVTQQGGTDPGTYACRELVIDYAAWISPAFNLKVLQVFLAAAQPVQELQARLAQQQAQIATLQAVEAERELARNPRLRQALRYARIEGLQHIECARLMGWTSTSQWFRMLHQLTALGLIDWQPNPGRSASGKAQAANLRLGGTRPVDAQRRQQLADMRARRRSAQPAHTVHSTHTGEDA